MKIVNKFDKRLLFLVLGLIAVFKFTESRVMSLTFVVAYTGVVFFYPALKPKTPEEQPRPLTPEEEEALKAEKEEQEKMKALKAAEAARKLREAEEAKRKEEEEEKKKKKKKQEENDIPPPAAAPSKEEKEEIPPPPLPVQEEKEVQHTRKKSVIPPPPPPATVPLDPKVKTKIWNMVMQELIDTEKYYIFMLGEIRTIYINPLKESKLVSAENIKEIFGIVEIIESYNNEAILKEFQKWGQEGVTVGQIFNKFTRNVKQPTPNIFYFCVIFYYLFTYLFL